MISYWLRHNPEDGGLAVDDFGWVSVERLLEALRSRSLRVDLSFLLQLNKSFDKIRWEIDEAGNRVRATHGHSFSVLLNDKVQLPPGVLYHGTALKNVPGIARQGLLPMRRQFVHLSETIETAIRVGARHGKPILIEVETERLSKGGGRFYKTSDNVWLTSAVPVDELNFRPWFPVTGSNAHSVQELKREIGNRVRHFLYSRLDDLRAVWQSSASDDTLFQDQKTGECFVVHLTYTKMKQEVEGWPRIEKYKAVEEWLEKRLWRDQRFFYGLK